MLDNDQFREHLDTEHGVIALTRDLRAHRVWHIEMHDGHDCGHLHDGDDLDRAAVLRRRRVTEDGDGEQGVEGQGLSEPGDPVSDMRAGDGEVSAGG